MAKGDVTIFAKEIQDFTDAVQELENMSYLLYTIMNGTYRYGAFGSVNITGNMVDAALQYGIDQGWSVTQNAILDRIGEIPGAIRTVGMTNNDFATLIKATILWNNSCGEPERLMNALQVLTNANNMLYSETPGIVVLSFGADTVIPNLYDHMKRLVVAGVKLILIQTGQPFLFDRASPNGFDSGTLA